MTSASKDHSVLKLSVTFVKRNFPDSEEQIYADFFHIIQPVSLSIESVCWLTRYRRLALLIAVHSNAISKLSRGERKGWQGESTVTDDNRKSSFPARWQEVDARSRVVNVDRRETDERV